MLSKDVQREMSLAEQIGNARLEIKLDDAPHTTQFRFFFDGISWIDATGGLENALAQLKRRVYEALRPAQKEEVPERPAVEPHRPETPAPEMPAPEMPPPETPPQGSDPKPSALPWERRKLKGRELALALALLFVNVVWGFMFRDVYHTHFSSFLLSNDSAEIFFGYYLLRAPWLGVIIVSADVLALMMHGRKKAAVLSTLAIWLSTLLLKGATYLGVLSPGFILRDLLLFLALACMFAPGVYMLAHARRIGKEQEEKRA